MDFAARVQAAPSIPRESSAPQLASTVHVTRLSRMQQTLNRSSSGSEGSADLRKSRSQVRRPMPLQPTDLEHRCQSNVAMDLLQKARSEIQDGLTLAPHTRNRQLKASMLRQHSYKSSNHPSERRSRYGTPVLHVLTHFPRALLRSPLFAALDKVVDGAFDAYIPTSPTSTLLLLDFQDTHNENLYPKSRSSLHG